MAEIEIRFLPDKLRVRVPVGSTILEAAQQAGITLETPCGGEGHCGKCRVKVRGAAPPPTAEETQALGAELLGAGFRLACQCRARWDLTVYIPPASRQLQQSILSEGVAHELALDPVVVKQFVAVPAPVLEDQRGDRERLLAAAGRPWASCSLALLRELGRTLRAADWQVTAAFAGDRLLAVEPGDTTAALYGIAFDVGTTTVVGYLLDLIAGREVAVASDMNAQVAHGEDVISRIQFATDNPHGLELLRRDIVGVLNGIIGHCCRRAGIDARHIYDAAVVGNTCMTHLLLGLPPGQLAVMPYVPVITAARDLLAAEVGLAINAAARCYVLPSIAGFVGADTVGVILAADLDRSRELRIAIDIGTNGEIVVAGAGRLVACSTAAGPAFEGATISRGMRATAGAIDAVSIGDDVTFATIDGAGVRGICGSGLIDAVAEMRRMGVVDDTGRMRPPAQADGLPPALARRLREGAAGAEFVVASQEQTQNGEPLTITSRDVRQLQLAKGAIYSGIEALLDEVGADASQVEEILLAGAFGNYVKRESAVALGLVPAVPLERIRSIGNAAGVGAKLALASRAARERAQDFAARVEYVELSARPDFALRFAEAMTMAPLAPGKSKAAGR
jgi:uncharacterized 2Fe-2S/4Fe-4S cluster protein (DUF4445 family)